MKRGLHYPLLTTILLLAALVSSHEAFSQSGYFGTFFQHQCRDTNQFYNYTLFSNAATNGDSNALALFTPYSAVGGVDENYHSGLFYSKSFSKWAIYNEKGSSDSISLYSSFNLLLPTTNGTALKHISAAGNIYGNLTLIDHPATNGKPNALLFITHNWGATGGIYNNHAAGVFYHPPTGKWGIYNEDLSTFPVGAVYNVFVVESSTANAFVHTTGTPSVSSPYYSFITGHSLNPNSVILVTHNLSPGGVSNNKYDTSAVGVGLKSSLNWLITNMDKVTPMDSGTTFNVLIAQNLPNSVQEVAYKNSDLYLFPNPTSSGINLCYELKESGTVEIKLFDLNGQQMRSLVNEFQVAGNYQITESLNDLSQGTYCYALSLNGVISRKLLVVMH